jgi:hypothetical protein
MAAARATQVHEADCEAGDEEQQQQNPFIPQRVRHQSSGNDGGSAGAAESGPKTVIAQVKVLASKFPVPFLVLVVAGALFVILVPVLIYLVVSASNTGRGGGGHGSRECSSFASVLLIDVQ